MQELFLYIRTIIGGFIIVQKSGTKHVRTFRVSNFKDEMLIIDGTDSTAYSFFPNPVHVSRTSNHLGAISLFSRNFLGKPRNVTRKQTRRSPMILDFSYINS